MKKLAKIVSAMLFVFSVMMLFTVKETMADNQNMKVYETYINPLYKDVLDANDIPDVQVSSVDVLAEPVYEDDLAQIILDIRAAMAARESSITVYYQSEGQLVSGYLSSWMDLVFAETNSPKEGDYLRCHCNGAKLLNSYYQDGVTGLYKNAITITLAYDTTAEQEAIVDNEVDRLIHDLKLNDSKKSQYEVIKAVYDYLCENVTYDYANLDDKSYMLKYTTYAALINKTSVCQGYATALYRILEEVGIDTRVVSGIGNGGRHAWNIVRISDTYYLADATWDAPRSTYEYFLEGTETFGDHHAESTFLSEYNISATPYQNSVNSHVAEGTCGPNAYWYLTDKGQLVIYGKGELSDSTGYREYEDSIKSLVIEEGIAAIGKDAFSYMNYVGGELVLPDSLTYIGEAAFCGCWNLTGVLDVPESVTEIDDYAFSGCYGLRGDVMISDNVTRIGDQAFYSCTGLSGDLVIGNNVTEIGNYAFAECTGLDGTITLGNKVETIGTSAFWSCSFRRGTLEIPASVKKIGDGAFDSCYFSGALVIPDTVTAIGARAFYGCRNITSLKLGSGISSIPMSAFEGCESLTGELVIPDTITTIGDSAFENCINLTGSLTIPDSVTYIGKRAFWKCEKMTGDLVIGDSVTYIGASAFMSCTGFDRSLVLGKKLDEIDEFAFMGCMNLQGEVIFPDSLTLIDDDAFRYCSKFTQFTFLNPECEIVDIADSAGATIPKSIVLSSYADSAVEAYALEHGYTFKPYCQHEWGTDYTVDKDATCTESGSKSIHCGKCDEVMAGSVVEIPMKGHNWTDWAVSKEASCMEDGMAERGCTMCDEKESKVLSALTHAPELQNVKEATCTEDGYTGDTVCIVCEEVLEIGQVIKKEGHIWNDGVVNAAATCTDVGEMLYTCKNCPETKSEQIPMKEHAWEDEYTVDVEATCTEEGSKSIRCADCDVKKAGSIMAVPAAGHDWSSWAVEKEPTYDAEGLEARTCKNCKEKETRPIEKLEKPISNPFTDVPSDQYYYQPVLWAVANNITNGTSATTFEPDKTCTRGQIVTFLWRAMGSVEPTSTDNPFTDVPSDQYYYKAVLWAVENGVTTGTGAGKFSPDNTCTRDQVVTFLWRAMGKPEPASTKNPFTDVPSGEYYYKPVLWAVEEGITTGTSKTTFGPGENCTRGHVVTFLYRTLV